MASSRPVAGKVCDSTYNGSINSRNSNSLRARIFIIRGFKKCMSSVWYVNMRIYSCRCFNNNFCCCQVYADMRLYFKATAEYSFSSTEFETNEFPIPVLDSELVSFLLHFTEYIHHGKTCSYQYTCICTSLQDPNGDQRIFFLNCDHHPGRQIICEVH